MSKKKTPKTPPKKMTVGDTRPARFYGVLQRLAQCRDGMDWLMSTSDDLTAKIQIELSFNHLEEELRSYATHQLGIRI